MITAATPSFQSSDTSSNRMQLTPTPTPTPSQPQIDKDQFQAARTLSEVVRAWRLVYEVYANTDLIDPNPYRIHTALEAANPQAAIFQGVINGQIESTLTAIEDDPQDGLPLDLVYKDELDQLRANGRRLVECGLFAHRCQVMDDTPDTSMRAQISKASRVKESLYQLMRLALYFGLNRCSTDWVIGVHPRHVRFYARAFGFHAIGPQRKYAAVNDRPVVLLHGDLDISLNLPKTPHVLKYCWANPVPPTLIEERFGFHPLEVANSHLPLNAYLQYKKLMIKRSTSAMASWRKVG